MTTAITYSALFQLLLPEVMIVIAALLVLTADLLFMRNAAVRTRFLAGVLISLLGCAGAIAKILLTRQQVSLFDGALLVNPQTQFIQIELLFLSIFVLVMSTESTFTSHVGEYIALILFATTSMLFLVSSQNLLLIFISLELLSLSLYILTAFNKGSRRAAEAALKYFLFGGMSAAFTLFGLSMVYGLSNSINLVQIANVLRDSPRDPLLMAAMVMAGIGFGFKVAAVPFHFWAPDVYEGAPAVSASLIASSAKVAGFVIFYQVIVVGFRGLEGEAGWQNYASGWVPLIAILAALSMVLGNLVAIVQISVRRLLAYSAISHAGYVLLALVSHTHQAFVAMLYYILTYGLTIIGAFGVIAVVEDKCGGDKLSDFAGLSRRAPVLSFCMAIFLLSLAGIPPLAGFFGKFYLFTSTLASDVRSLAFLWLVVVAIATSTISLYYYLQVLKRIYVLDQPAGSGRIRPPLLNQCVICVIAGSVVILGCVPNLLLQWIPKAIGTTK